MYRQQKKDPSRGSPAHKDRRAPGCTATQLLRVCTVAGIPQSEPFQSPLGQPTERGEGVRPRDPRHPREPREMRHTPPAPLSHTEASKFPPASQGRVLRLPTCKQERSPGSSLTRDRPRAGGVGESRLGRRDPRGAQAGAAKRRTPVRGNRNRNQSQSGKHQERN